MPNLYIQHLKDTYGGESQSKNKDCSHDDILSM